MNEEAACGRPFCEGVDREPRFAFFSPSQDTYFSCRDKMALGRMTKPDIWYVSFGADRALKPSDGAVTPARTTRAFKSEADARTFAMEIVRKGWNASAGTINPHQPKQMIGPSEVEDWARGKQQA